MPLYLYAVLDARPRARLRGIRREPLRYLAWRRMTLAAGEMKSAPAPSPRALAAHDRVVRALAEKCQSILPVRFGTTVAGVTALDDSLGPLARRLAAALKAVRGCEQLTARAPDPRPAPPARRARSGAEYLERRRDDADPSRVPGIVALRAATAGLVRAERLERRVAPVPVATAYHLIRRGDAPAYRRAAAAAGVTIGGPYPPYAFAPGTGGAP